MNLLEKYKNVINELKNNNYVEYIILFGSYAKNKVKPLSDLDICIIVRKNTPKEIIDDILSYGTDELDISIFHKLPLSLQYKILVEGKVLYANSDLNKLRNLKHKTVNKWFDFRVVLNNLYKKKGYKPIF
jgi:predicted nucleotidyltransferase